MAINRIRDRASWRAALSAYPDADVYHSYDYLKLCAEEEGARDFFLLELTDGHCSLMLPIIEKLVPCSDPDVVDYSGPHGFPGPLIKGPWAADRLTTLWLQLAEELKAASVVSLSTRLNPFAQQKPLLSALGEVMPVSDIVCVDLRTASSDQQFDGYRSNHKRDVNSLLDAGATCVRTDLAEGMDVFLNLYRPHIENLSNKESSGHSEAYFRSLSEITDFNIELFVVHINNNAICAGLFLLGDHHAHYHLGATDPNARHLAPSKLLLDAARLHANTLGMAGLNLGGGVGGRRDALFNFKLGFSKNLLPYEMLLSIFDHDRYAELSHIAHCRAQAAGKATDPKFWPQYRAAMIEPTVVLNKQTSDQPISLPADNVKIQAGIA